MTKRLLTICVLLLLLCIPAQAAPGEPDDLAYIPWPGVGSDWELVATVWDPPQDALISALEWTVRFEYPSNRSGYLTTELYTDGTCPNCVEVPMEINFWAHQPVLGNQQLWMYWYVMEDHQDWWAIPPQQLGWDRRYHQFRIWIKMYASAFKFEVYDCDTQEVLFSNSEPYPFYSITGDIRRMGSGLKFSHWTHNAKIKWEGHWATLETTPSVSDWRWDQIPWAWDGGWLIDKSEADRIDHGPIRHLYDDHPEACTGRIIWPASTYQGSDVEPLFKTEPTPADLDSPARLVHEQVNMGAVEVTTQTQAPVVPLIRPTPPPELPEVSYLALVLSGPEDQAHWNEVTIWYRN